MKAAEFINEEGKENVKQYAMHDMSFDLPEHNQVKNAEHLVQIIESNCSEMLAAYRASRRVLLRGIHGGGDALITNIRPDRKPMQMNSESHVKLHKAFLAAGIKSTRMNSIFCTERENIAGTWGNTRIIFIKDGWSGVVFQKYKTDYSFYKMQDIGRMEDIDKMVKEILLCNPLIIENAQTLTKVLAQQYADILMTGSSYIALDPSSALCNETFKLLKIKPKNATISAYDWGESIDPADFKGLPTVG